MDHHLALEEVLEEVSAEVSEAVLALESAWAHPRVKEQEVVKEVVLGDINFEEGYY
jgi:hypothetical protein